MSRVLRAISLTFAMIPPTAAACPVIPGGTLVKGEIFSLGYRLEPAELAVGEHFSLDLTLCDAAGRPIEGVIGIDALMPAHSHGMNYAPRVTSKGAGQYHAEGMMLHMPGTWQFVFWLQSGQNREQITVDYLLN